MDVTNKLGRRSFLFLIGAGVGSAAAVVTGAKVSPRVAMTEKSPEPVRQRVSEHVRNYYRTTRI